MKLSKDDKVIGGVCGGIAEALGISSAVIRLGFVIFTLVGVGSPILLYLAAWLVLALMGGRE